MVGHWLYATKTCPAYIDMIVKLRRILIAAQFHPGDTRQPTPRDKRRPPGLGPGSGLIAKVEI